MPAVAAGAAPELDSLRTACDRVIAGLIDSGPDILLVIGGGLRQERFGSGDWGGLHGYGVDVPVTLGNGSRTGRGGLPLSLTIGSWLLSRNGDPGPLVGFSVPAGAPDCDLAAWAGELLASGARPGLLVMGDGSARRSVHAPGYADERAGTFDAAVAAALAGGHPAALRDLDPVLGGALLAAGTDPWRLAGHLAGDRAYRGDLLYDAAPYGVGYLAAVWRA